MPLFNPQAHLIFVDAKLIGPRRSVSLRLALDTGASATMVNAASLFAAGYDPGSDANRIQITTASSVEFVPELAVESLSALGKSRDGLRIISHTLPPSATIDGVLGLDFFRNLRLVIDFRKGLIEID